MTLNPTLTVTFGIWGHGQKFFQIRIESRLISILTKFQISNFIFVGVIEYLPLGSNGQISTLDPSSSRWFQYFGLIFGIWQVGRFSLTVALKYKNYKAWILYRTCLLSNKNCNALMYRSVIKIRCRMNPLKIKNDSFFYMQSRI